MRSRRRSGFTMLECLIASVVLALAVVAMANALVAGGMQTQNALHEERALALGEALLEEILSHPYADPAGATTLGPEAGESGRAKFDNIDDYHGYTEAFGGVADASGAAYPAEYQDYRRSVTMAAGSVDAGLGAAVTGLTISVQVTDRAGRTWTITRFVAEPKG